MWKKQKIHFFIHRNKFRQINTIVNSNSKEKPLLSRNFRRKSVRAFAVIYKQCLTSR